MDNPPSPASPYFSRIFALRIGGHTFFATWLLTLSATLVAVFGVPLLAYVFGSGWVAPLVAALMLFGLLLLFRKYMFRNLNKSIVSSGDAAWLEHDGPGTPDDEEAEIEIQLLENAPHLRQVRAQDCMIPRPEIVHITVENTPEELQRVFTEQKLSRVLVTDGDLDTVLGYVSVQQMLAQPHSIRSMVTPITFVPESIAVNNLLSKFIRNQTNIACVVDEYGSLSGLVTLQDLLALLSGDMDDGKHGQKEYTELQLGEREYLFSGRLKLEYLNEKYPALALPPGDYQTLSGYLVTVGQNIPEQGQHLELEGKTFIFEVISDHKVETVRVLM